MKYSYKKIVLYFIVSVSFWLGILAYTNFISPPPIKSISLEAVTKGNGAIASAQPQQVQAQRPQSRLSSFTHLVQAPMVGVPLGKEFYSNAPILSHRETSPDNQGVSRRIKIVQTDFKYPFIRVEEILVRNPKTGEEQIFDQKAMVADHIIVKLKPGMTEQDLQLLNQKYRATIQQKMLAPDTYVVGLSDQGLDALTNAIAAYTNELTTVAYAEPDYIAHLAFVPNDQQFSQLWGMNNTGQTGGTNDADIDAPETWDITTGSRSIKVGVIDTGADYNHPDLAANIWTNPGEIPDNGIDDDGNGFIDDFHGWNFVSNNNNPMDDSYHGTHVAGIIGAIGNNSIGVVGVCWNVSIIPLKSFNSEGSGAITDLINAVYYSTRIGVDLTSNSWTEGYSQSLKDAIEDARTHDILFIAAAGNDGLEAASFPAAYESPNIISVAATDHKDLLAWFSNFGILSVDVSAPGESILSTTPQFTTTPMQRRGLSTFYSLLSGTSMATPHVAGVCALLKSEFPSLDAQQIKTAVVGSSDKLSSLIGTSQQEGRLNVRNAINEASNGSKVNISGPLNSLNKPGEQVAIIGSALGVQNYQLFQKPLLDSNWTPITGVIANPVANSLLGKWDTTGLNIGNYLLQLRTISSIGTTIKDNIGIVIEEPFAFVTSLISDRSGIGWNRISGDRLLFQDAEKFYLYDFNSQIRTQIAEDVEPFRPSISGDYIVWAGYSGIYLYDIPTGTQRNIPNLEQAYDPYISGNRIVYVDNRIGENNFYEGEQIYVYEISTGNERKLTSDWIDSRVRPKISGNRVTWAEGRFYPNELWEIYTYDLATNTKQFVTSSSKFLESEVEGNRIIWTDSSDGPTDLFLYDVSTGLQQQITNRPGNRYSPRISGDLIVWSDDRANNPNHSQDIFCYDLATRQEKQLTANMDDQVMPDISGNRIVWSSFHRFTDLPTPAQGIFLHGSNEGVPSAPSSLMATVGSSQQINLTWTDNSRNETGFKIERKTEASGTYAQITLVGSNVTNFSDLAPLQGATYYYRVRASNVGGDSTYSNETSATILSRPPLAPSNLTAKAISQHQINLRWKDKSCNETGFKIERKIGSKGSYIEIATAGPNVTTFSNTRLWGHTRYYYRVRAINSEGCSAYSNQANATTWR